MKPELVDAILEAIDAGTKAVENRLLTRCAHLQAEVDAVKAELHERQEKGGGQLSYKGRWEPTTTYQAGDCVGWDGSMWIALTACHGRQPDAPSSAEKVWSLAVMRGRPGKDAR